MAPGQLYGGGAESVCSQGLTGGSDGSKGEAEGTPGDAENQGCKAASINCDLTLFYFPSQIVLSYVYVTCVCLSF